MRNGRELSDTLFQLFKSRSDADYVWDEPYSVEHADAELQLAKALLSELGEVNDFDRKKFADRIAQTA